MSLKEKIKNLAKKKDMSAQVVLQNYMFERFLERISKSDYKNKFILKGGMLIAAIVGINIQKEGKMAKPYQVKLILKVLEKLEVENENS